MPNPVHPDKFQNKFSVFCNSYYHLSVRKVNAAGNGEKPYPPGPGGVPVSSGTGSKMKQEHDAMKIRPFAGIAAAHEIHLFENPSFLSRQPVKNGISSMAAPSPVTPGHPNFRYITPLTVMPI